MMQKFEARLHRPEGRGTWTYVTAPFNVENTFGKRGRVPVSGKIDGQSFSSSLLPHGNGHHILVVKKQIRDLIGKHAGASVLVELKLDTASRVVTLPKELIEILSNQPEVNTVFKELSYSHQKEFAEWIGSAKKPATREQRSLTAIDMITSGKRPKS